MTPRVSLGTRAPVRRSVGVPGRTLRAGVGLARDGAGHVLLSVHHGEGDALIAELDDDALDRISGQLADLLLADPRLAQNDR